MSLALATTLLMTMIQALSAQHIPSSVPKAMCRRVDCGRGSCRESPNSTFGFECECDPGWTRFQFTARHLPFPSCAMPNCVFDRNCYNDSMARPPSTLTQPTNRSLLFDPCMWSFCGRGRCVRTTGFGHRCECTEGFSNLLNHTDLPCLKECVVTADCPTLRVPLSNGSSSPSNFAEKSSSADFSARGDCLWALMIVMCLLMPLRIERANKSEVHRQDSPSRHYLSKD